MKQFNIKKTVIEIIIILSASTIIALFYNLMRTDSLPFFPKSKDELIIDDNILFGDHNLQDTLKNNDDKNKTQQDTMVVDSNLSAQDALAITDTTSNLSENIDIETMLKNAKKSNQYDFHIVTFEQVKKIVNMPENNNFVIIDARRPDQFAAAHIPKSINIFPDEDEKGVIEKVLNLPKNKTIIIYCDGGNCELSYHLASLLDNFNYKNVYIYEAGWEDWIKKK